MVENGVLSPLKNTKTQKKSQPAINLSRFHSPKTQATQEKTRSSRITLTGLGSK